MIQSDVTMNFSASCTAEKCLSNGTRLDYLLKLEFGDKFNGMSAVVIHL